MNAPDTAVVSPMPHVMNTYGRLPIALSHGRGCWVWDTEGRKYLDGLGGIAVNTLGHAHPKLVPALQEQIGKLIHSSNYYEVPLQEQLAAKLCELSGLDAVFFCSTGLEANEGALKIARKYGHDRGIERPEVIVYEGAFHGRSIATLSATANPKVQAGFGPLVEGFVRVPLNDLAAVERVARENPNVVAVFLETIQGEGGIHPSRWDYLQGIRKLCDQKNWLLMLDEVQCGIGRTGKWFAHQWAGIRPDVMPLAKGLGSGVPVGAIVVGPKAKNVLGPGNHGTTFGGNPLAMRAGVETLRIMVEDGVMANAATVGAALKAGLERELKGVAGVVEVRGQGLMLGIELDRPCGVLLQRAAEAGLMLSVTADKVIRLVPPLILSADEAAHDRRHPVPADPRLPGRRRMKPGHSLMKHYLQFKDLRAEEYAYLFERTRIIKTRFKNYEKYQPLADRTLAMIFEKASTRTRVSFEAGMYQMGGSVVHLTTGDSQLGRAEPVEDSARVISRMVDLVMIRTYEQAKIAAFAAHSRVPVINGLTNEYHPCQILADIYTYIEQRGAIQGKVVAWVGDGNNMANTWLQAAEILGFTVHVSTPSGYEVDPAVAGISRRDCYKVFKNPMDACRGADLVTTDVWTSMGYEAENQARQKAFADWCVDAEMMAAARPEALFMHCLPAHRGEEVAADVIDGPQSVVWDEAENRLHVQKGLMEYLLLGRIG